MSVGILFVVIGVFFLLKNSGYLAGIGWELVWPVLLIVTGLSMMKKGWCWRHGCGFWRQSGICCGASDENDNR